MSDSAITIAIPFHRGLPYLEEAVASVVAQRDPSWRLIVCDDGGERSPDAAGAEALVASLDDRRARYVRNPVNLGMVGNWNRQFELAETDLLTLLHQDDRLLPDYVGIMRELADAHPDAAAFHCAARIIGPDGRPVFSMADRVKPLLTPGRGERTRLAGRPAVEALLRGNFIMCPTLCYRRSLIGERRFDPRFKQVQDLELLIRLLMEGEVIVGTRREAFLYRRHDESATSQQSESLLRFEEERDLLDELARASAARGWDRAARIARQKRIVKLHLGYRVLTDVLHRRWRAAATKARFALSLARGR